MASETPSTSEVWFGQSLVPGKVPLKKNLFEEVIHATGTLESGNPPRSLLGGNSSF